MKFLLKAVSIVVLTITVFGSAGADTLKIFTTGTGPLSIVGALPYFCKKYDLDVQVTQQANSSPVSLVPLLVRGDYDIATPTLQAILISLENGVELTIATAVLSGGDALFVQNNVKSISDLKGKRIAMLKSTVAESYTMDLLQKANLSFTGDNPDVTIVNMPLEAMKVAYDTGAIDAFAGIFPDTTDLEDAKKGKVLVEFNENQRFLFAMKSFYEQPKAEKFYKCWADLITVLRAPESKQRSEILSAAIEYGKATQGLHVLLPSNRKHAHKISIIAYNNTVSDIKKYLVANGRLKPTFEVPPWFNQSHRNVIK